MVYLLVANVATFAAGCFWGVEHIFKKHYPFLGNAPNKIRVGYTNGRTDVTDPTYRQVCSGVTEYAEAVRIEFNPEEVSYATLVGKCYSANVIDQFYFEKERGTEVGCYRALLPNTRSDDG